MPQDINRTTDDFTEVAKAQIHDPDEAAELPLTMAELESISGADGNDDWFHIEPATPDWSG